MHVSQVRFRLTEFVLRHNLIQRKAKYGWDHQPGQVVRQLLLGKAMNWSTCDARFLAALQEEERIT